MTDPTRDKLEGTTGERYVIEGFLAEGGMGKVYLARNRALGSRVAIKVLPPEVAGSDVRLARFKREAALAANLSHPNIVPVFEFDATPQLAYLVMPFVEGKTLAEELVERGRLEMGEVQKLLEDVGGALAFAHRNAVVHRDIKPANIMRESGTGRWLVTDFGVAHTTGSEDTEITVTGTVLGTPTYMSPEQAIGGPVDARTDLYSLAAVAVQALSGIGYDDLTDCLARGRPTIDKVLTAAQPRIRLALVKALTWPLEKVPDDRPPSAPAWLEALSEAERTQSLYRWAWVAALVAAFIGIWTVARPGSNSAGRSEGTTETIAVLPFRGTLPAGQQTIQVADLSEAFEWQLRSIPGLPVLRAQIANELQRRYGSVEVEPDTLIALARELESTIVLEGRVSPKGDLVTISVRAWSIRDERELATAVEEGTLDDLDQMVSSLVKQAVADPLALQLSGSGSLPNGLSATSAYIQGKKDLRRGSYANAVASFDQVIGLDSTFAPAPFYRMLALIFDTRPSEYSAPLTSALETASIYRDGLSQMEQEILRGYETLILEGDITTTEEIAIRIVEQNPRAYEAQFLLGYLQFNFGALLGRTRGEARYRFQQVVALQPDYAMAWWHLGMIAASENEAAQSDEYLGRLLGLDSTSTWAETARMTVRFHANPMAVVETLNQSSLGALELASVSLGDLMPPPGGRTVAGAALSEFWQRATTDSDLRLAFRIRMAQLIAEGKWESAKAHLLDGVRRNVARDEIDRWTVLSAITPLPDLAAEPELVQRVDNLLATDFKRAEARWLAARWLLEHGSRMQAERAITDLRQAAAAASPPSPLALSLVSDIAAIQSLERGDSAQADSIWVAATARYSIVDDLLFGLTASLWPLRLRHAQLLAARAEHEVAIDVADTFSQLVIDQVAWPWILELLGQSAASSGNRLRATNTFDRLEEILESAEGSGLDWLEEIRRRRAALGL